MKRVLLGAVCVVLGGLGVWFTFPELWFTPDQRAMRLYERGDFSGAAAQFESLAWRGAAQFEAGDFEAAARSFAGVDTPEGAFNRGNALIFMGAYDKAIESYDRALAARPDWSEAVANRAIAESRRLEQKGGEGTGGKLGADEIVFEEGGSAPGDEVEVTEGEPLEGAELNALWLRNVRTTPGDFLRLKFAYQRSARDADGDAPGADE